MGIYLGIRTAAVMPSARIMGIARLNYAWEAAEYLSRAGLFKATNIEVWFRAPSEPLGGALKKTIIVENLSEQIKSLTEEYNVKCYRDEWFDTIILINGTWRFWNEHHYDGYISIHNSESWRRAYKDIELDIFGTEEKGDLALLLLDNEAFPYMIKDFVDHITTRHIDNLARISEIYVTIGAPEFGNVEGLIAIHVANWVTMIRYFYTQMREERSELFERKIAPIAERFYRRSLAEQPIVANMFNRFVTESDILEFKGKSVTYIAKDGNSFRKFYERFKKEVFEKTAEGLPDINALKQGMVKGLGIKPTLGEPKKLDEIFR